MKAMLPKMTRLDLVKIIDATASHAKLDGDDSIDTKALTEFARELTKAGLYTEATEDELEKADELI